MAPIFGLSFWGTYKLADSEKIKVGDLFNNPIVKVSEEKNGTEGTTTPDTGQYSSKDVICKVTERKNTTYCTDSSSTNNFKYAVDEGVKKVYQEALGNSDSSPDMGKLFDGLSKWCEEKRNLRISDMNATLNWHMIQFCSEGRIIRR